MSTSKARKPRNTEEVLHYWAHQILPEGKVASVSYQGPVLLSYSTPIAMLLGNDTVLFSTETYSVTTTQHMSKATRATIHMRRICAPVLLRYFSHDWELNLMHSENKRIWIERIVHQQAILKIHPRRKLSVGRELHSLINAYMEYRDYFKLVWENLYDDETLNKITREFAEVEVAKELVKKADSEARLARKKLEQEERLTLWRAGKVESVNYPNIALRIKGDEVESSQCAHCKIEEVKNLWPIMLDCYKCDVALIPHELNRPIKIGVYTVTSFNADKKGTFIAGCHTIKREELNKLAELLDLEKFEEQSTLIETSNSENE